jgi:hypothetical protein
VRKWTILLVIVLIFPFHLTVKAETLALKAAFVRGDDLWVKSGDQEVRITKGDFIRYPKWSPDGHWIAYLKSKQEDLWLYDLTLKRHYQIGSNIGNHFQWSPLENKIGFLASKELFIIDAAKPNRASIIAGNIENFSWLPNKMEILTSAKKSSKLNSDIILSKVSLATKKSKHFFTIPIGKNEIYVSTSSFKWSADHKWLSFLIVPTASLSADSNTLCILSADGKIFKRIDEMLKFEDWFEWSPSGRQLGYIGGVGREALFRKQLRTADVPSFHVKALTPKGYADRGFAWVTDDILFAARSQESDWLVDVKKRAMTSLFTLRLSTHFSKQVTFPNVPNGDFTPKVWKEQLVWLRTDRETATVFVSPLKGSAIQEDVWIKNVTVSSWYYEKWYWDEVFSLFLGRS